MPAATSFEVDCGMHCTSYMVSVPLQCNIVASRQQDEDGAMISLPSVVYQYINFRYVCMLL
jgi:hypothetical protein